ncbi:class I SAM-dependent methyltransferase [Streptomyces sp. NPDC087300]|uniref:class I SAM-dependent methyltransferase n=1 Tax=Streptomyces sp. NPDC087300 TaxID=3365780 RepID=UPI0037F4459F
MSTAAPDLWHHYGRTRAATDQRVPDAFHWTWSQDCGPGPDILGDLAGRCVGDLGAGAARHAAYLAVRHRAAQVIAVDASPAQHAMATSLFGHLAPRLRIVHCDVVDHLRAATGTYDVLYSVFGAIDFVPPGELLPAAAAALRPGGQLVFSTLAHYLDGAPAQSDVQCAEIPAKTPDGQASTMPRWVLQEQVWTKALREAGFTTISTQELLAPCPGPRTARTLLVQARTTGFCCTE